MTKWLLLAGSILSEVTGSLSLKGALDRPGLYVLVAAGYSPRSFSSPSFCVRAWRWASPTAFGAPSVSPPPP